MQSRSRQGVGCAVGIQRRPPCGRQYQRDAHVIDGRPTVRPSPTWTGQLLHRGGRGSPFGHRGFVQRLNATAAYEASLSERFLAGIDAIDGVRLYGVDRPEGRTPTFALAIDGMAPDKASRLLGEQGIFTWAGHYYALEVMQHLGMLDQGGLLRIGFVHYTTPGEVDLVLAGLERLAAGAPLEGLPLP